MFIKWLTEPEQQAFWIENNHFIPIRYSTATYLADYFLLHPQYTQIPNWLQYSDFEPPLISYPTVREQAGNTVENIILADADITQSLKTLDFLGNSTQGEFQCAGGYLTFLPLVWKN